MDSKCGRSPLDRRAFLCTGGLVLGGLANAEGAVPDPLPSGVKAVWDLGKAHRDKTATRERVCLNGLWRWQPGKEVADSAPADGWGYFKVPGFWPGNSNYIQEDCRTLQSHPKWKDTDVQRITAAWYQRELTVPEGWAGRRLTLSLGSAGLSLSSYAKDELAANCVIIVGPGGGRELVGDAVTLGKWLKKGGHVLALGLDEAETEAFLPHKVGMKKGEHIAASFEPPGQMSLLVGSGSADVHNRDPRELHLVTMGASILGNGILAQADHANVVFCQIVPWQFDPKKQMNLKRTFRRAAVLVTRLAANMGATSSTPLLSRFRTPVEAPKGEARWRNGFYLDTPEEWDDPYRFFRWCYGGTVPQPPQARIRVIATAARKYGSAQVRERG